ncbi:hypothetical protein FN846DRAFT_960598 [Sphaerosporella brunnea]|uniref:Uncharacterized protein n=1 Tax=Sphaerosporella brunnea TaxID=1250544 RepID=A0A5J5EP65_9PEZI|nr:hypothetical protein FN846DRAFT_960598 [Sphaerosporella brunnea]
MNGAWNFPIFFISFFIISCVAGMECRGEGRGGEHVGNTICEKHCLHYTTRMPYYRVLRILKWMPFFFFFFFSPLLS